MKVVLKLASTLILLMACSLLPATGYANEPIMLAQATDGSGFAFDADIVNEAGEAGEAEKAGEAGEAEKAPTSEASVKTEKVEEVKTPQQWWQSLLYEVFVNLIVPIFGTVLSAHLFLLFRKLNLKADLQNMDNLAGKAALYAEHMAASWFKDHGEKAPGAAKMGWAFDLIEKVDEGIMLRKKANEKLRALILAKIPEAERTASAK